MKTAVSVLCAIVLLAGATGCNSCCFPWRTIAHAPLAAADLDIVFVPMSAVTLAINVAIGPAPIVRRSQLYPRLGYAEDYGKLSRADRSFGGFANQDESTDEMETARGYRIVPGSDRVVTHSGRPKLARGYGRQEESADEMETAQGYRIVPGSDRVITRSGRPTLARGNGRPTPALMADELTEDESTVAPARIRSKRASRVRTVRPRQLQQDE